LLQTDAKRRIFSHLSVTSPGYVARRGKTGNKVMGHSRWISGPSRCSSCSM